MTEAQIIADLKSKGYTSVQAYAICKSRMKPKAQFGFGNPQMAQYQGAFGKDGIPYANADMFSTPQVQTAQYQGAFGASGIPYADPSMFTDTTQVESTSTQNTQEINKTVIDNPFGGVSLENALNYAGRGFREKDPWKAGIGTSLSLLKGSRNFLSGYGAGKVNREGYEDYIKNLNKDMTPNQAYQSGGKFKNSEVLAMNALTDNPFGNTNTEGGEFVKRTNGMVQPVIGEPHVKNGKKADGVDVKLNDGDKVLSDYIKLRPNDIKELKERYKIALKKGDTPAKALAKIETKIGLKKETEKLADSAEKLEKALKIKDPTSKELSIQTLENIIATQNEKIANLKQVSAVAFEDLFEMQEEQPKKDTSKLYDKNGKEVEDEEDDNMQMGGVYELASKFGISKERAKELVSMQMGGEQNEVPQEQIMQMVMQMLQEGASPEQVVQQLIQQGLPQDQAVQVVEMMIQQAQGQMEAPQEGMEMAQQGLTYEQIVAKNLAEGTNLNTPGLWTGQTATNFYTPYTNWENYLGRTPKDITTQEIYQKGITSDLNPQITKLIESGEMPLTNKHRELLRKSGVKNADKIIDYTTLSQEDKKKVGKDFIINGYIDNLAGHRGLAIQQGDLSQEEYAKLTGAYDKLTDKEGRQIYAKYDKDGKIQRDEKGNLTFYYPKKMGVAEKKVEPSKISENTTQIAEELDNTNQELGVENRVKRAMAFLPTDLRLPPSGVPPLLKSEVNLGRIEPIKQTVEPYLANQASQLYTAQEQLSATGLPPQIQQALQAQAFASNQMASNDAISKVEQFNAGQQFNADQFNIGQRAKEDITNEQFAQSYQDKMLGSIANTERDYRNYLIEGNLQNRASWKDIENANLLNANVENYQYTPGVGVDYIDNRAGDLSQKSALTPEQISNMSDEEYWNYVRLETARRKKKLANNQQ